MFELIKRKNYDTHNRWGTDWHTDYHFKSDKKLTIEEVCQELKKLNHEPTGCLSLKENVLETVMF